MLGSQKITPEKLHQDTRRCKGLPFSDVGAKACKCVTSDYFIGALNDPHSSTKVRERNPKTLDEALFAAQQIEVRQKLRKRNMDTIRYSFIKTSVRMQSTHN